MKGAAAHTLSASAIRPDPSRRPQLRRPRRHALVPPNFRDPAGLTLRLLRSRDPAAYFALGTTLLAALAAPFDRLLELRERRLYERARAPRRPVVFVTGAPRSGTTLVAQALGRHLPVAYFNNLTALFPRSPIVANQLLGPRRVPAATYRSFYGRTSGLGAENDGLHLWDRWMGPDRYAVPERFDAETADDLRRFFGAYEAAFGRPVLNKNNALATCAGLIARTLPSAHFIYVRREPAFAVQSILGARETIQGTRAAAYGVGAPSGAREHGGQAGPIAEVCAQVLHHERRMLEQAREIGGRRFWVVEYEDFCRAPHRLVERAAGEILGVALDGEALRAALPPFDDANQVRLAPAEFAAIRRTLARSSAGRAA
jgi:hypothetical protein